MFRFSRFWQSPGWRKALDVDSDLAEAEGLAAGTGLLTGGLLRNSKLAPVPCPQCGGPGDAMVIDLVARLVTRRCQDCGHRWASDEPVPSHHRS